MRGLKSLSCARTLYLSHLHFIAMLYSFMCSELPGLSSLHLLLTEAEYGYIADFPEGETDSPTDSAAHWGTSVV